MSFTATPLDGSAAPIPMSSAVPDGTNTPLAIEGGPAITTGGNTLVPVSIYEKDGNNVALGATTDVAVTGDSAGTQSAKMRGFLKIWTDIWDSVNHRIHVNVDNANANGQAAMAASAPVVIASNQTTIPTLDTNSAASKADLDTIVPGIQGWIAATGTGTAAQDDSLTFANQVRKVVLYNAAAVPVPFEFDTVSTATSFPIAPGQSMVFDGVLCTVVHVFPSATLPINTTAGLYVKGWK